MLDGPSVKEGEYGLGEIALRPRNLPKHVAHIRNHWGENYEKVRDHAPR